MKLHYSQTDIDAYKKAVKVLIPYEITLFSNMVRKLTGVIGVLIPYEITLFSNT